MSSFTTDRKRAFKASADLSAKQYFAVGLDTSNVDQVVLANAQTLPAIGILQNAPESGDVADVALANAQGTSKAIYGGSVSIGDWLTPTTNGKLIATTTAGDVVVGRALNAGSDGLTGEIALAFFRY